MTPGTGIFQTKRFTDVLRRALVIAMLALLATPIAAAPLVLNCESSTGNYSRQFRIDFDNKSVQELDVSPQKNPPARADITDTSIRWTTISVRPASVVGGEHEWNVVARINRTSGEILWEAVNSQNPMQADRLLGKCRQATQKF